MELRIVLICVFISVLDQSDGQDLRSVAAAPLDSGRLQPAAKASLIPSVCRKAQNGSSSLSVEIQLPFMDMELHHEGQLHVLQDEQLLLVLHGHELFQWHIAGEDKRLVRLGQLEGRVRQQLSAVAAAVVLWHEDLLFAVALPDTLEFYQLPQEQLLNSTQWHLLPIQEFSLPGKLHQLQLLKTKLDQVVLLLTVNSTQTQSKCITFEWLDTYFNPVSELNLPALEAFQVVGHQPYYIITGRSLRTQSALVLTVYELETPSLRLRRRQSLTVHARHVRTTRFRGRNHLIACGRNATALCLLFRMVDGNFVVYRKHMLQQLHFTHLASSPRGQLVAATRGNGEVLVFNSHRFDCYSGFGADPNPSGVYVHRNPLNETFLMLAYQRQSNVTLLRMVQLGGSNDTAGNSLDGSDDLSSVQVHRHEFEESINALRSLLLRRKQKVDALHRLTLSMKTKQKELHLGSGSHVEQVHLQGEHLQTPMQLKHRLKQLRQHYAVNRRSVRSFGVGNDSSSMGQEVLKVRRLHVRNLIYNGELMPNYYVDNSNSPILTIKGTVLTNKLQTQQLLTPQNYKRPSRAIDPLQQHVGQGNLVVRQLHVARINNVSWFDFYDSLFLQSRDNLIEGRLIVQSRARVVNLETPLLNGLVVDQLFNLRQPQLISSNIFMSAFFVPKLEAKLINGLDFANDIVFRGDNATLIKTPVHIYQMNVSGSLLVANDTKWRSNRTPETETETEGSVENRLQQYYTGSVILNGSLTVQNVVRDTNATQLLLGEQSLRQQDLHKDYLLLQGEQQLAALMFGNAKVTTPQLNSNHINGHPVAEHLLDAEQQLMNEANAKPLHIIFMDAQIEGDLRCSNYTTRLAQIAKDAVRQGETAIITGHKQFEAELTVETLHSNKLNGIDIADEFVLKSQPMQNFSHLKSFERIVVKQQATIGDELTVQELNSLPMAQLLQRGYSLQRLELATASTPQLQHLQFQRLNNLAFDELLGLLSVNEEQQQLLLHKQLIIEGNVRFEQPLQLHTINGIQWDSYVQRLVNSQTNTLIEGQKIFGETVMLTDALQAPSINGLDLSALLDNTLLRSTPQSISGNYNIGRITVGNLDVPAVNEVPASSFIDTRQKQKPLQLRGNLNVQQLSINGSLSCQLANDPLPQLDTQLAAMQQRQWGNIWVLGDALWQQSDATVDEQPQLNYLRQHAVRRRGGATQTISGQVTLKQPQFNKLQTLQNFPTSLNLTHIAADALLRQSNATQIVRAPQLFVQHVQAGVVRTLKDCHVQLLNEFDPTRLNASLYRRSSGQPIAAQLRFVQPPDVKRLSVEGRLNGGDLAGIFEQSATAVWPAVQLQQLHVQQHLQLDEINGMHLEFLLQNRVPLRSSQPLELFGTLSFEQLELGANIRMRSINDIALSQVVYKHGERLQAISGAKTFDGGIVLHGPAHVMQLNGRDLSDSYQQSIFTDRDYSIDSLRLDGATFEAGLLPLIEQQARQAAAGGEELLPQQLQQLEQQLKISQAQHTQRLRYLDYEPQVYAAIWNATESATENDSDVEAAIVQHTQQPLLSSSSCQQQELRARLSRAQQRVLISHEQRVLHATAQQGALHVQADNNCQASKLKLKSKLRSRIHITCRGEQHTLGMRQHVRQLQLLELPPQFSGNNLLLLLGTLEEVRVLHINMANCSLSDWQSLPHGAAQLMQVLQLPDAGGTFLLTAPAPAPALELPALAVHRLVTASQRFEPLQLIEGDFDLAELQQSQLFLSCRRCRRIDVHEFDAELQHFRPLQQLRLEARVQQLLPFGVGQEQHLLVLTLGGSSNFYLLSYTHLGAWQPRTYGQMGDVLWSWPLIQPGEQLRRTTAVLLLCGELQCNEVSALLD